jgi:IS5 family transposase
MNGFERYTKKTRRQVFLEEMEQVVPWRELCATPLFPAYGFARLIRHLIARRIRH